MSVLKLVLVFCSVYYADAGKYKYKRPNIVFFYADDLGWNDVGYHGSSEIPTPNIDALAMNGVALEKYYTQASCSPSRAALLTGNYPIRYGKGYQTEPILPGEKRVLDPNIQTLPKELQKLGYKTHLIGKWHLGAVQANATPTHFGYDTHYGYWEGFIGYLDHKLSDFSFNMPGVDLHDGLKAVTNESGNYFTDLITKKALDIIDNHDEDEPLYLSVHHLASHTGRNEGLVGYLEVPDVNVTNEKYGYLADPNRRLLADVTQIMDASIGTVIERLKSKGMLDNSIIVFCSDNGAPSEGMFLNYGSNFPFRGMKMSPFEGGIRVPAVVYSPMLKNKGRVYNKIFHVSDWAPTLYAAAGGRSNVFASIDGVNQWNNIRRGTNQDLRKELLIEISDRSQYYAIIGNSGRFKLVNGSLMGNYVESNYIGVSGSYYSGYDYTVANSLTNLAVAEIERRPPLSANYLTRRRTRTITRNCRPTRNIEQCRGKCLYDLSTDPCETTDVSQYYPEVVERLMNRLEYFKSVAKPLVNNFIDRRADPALCCGTWWPYMDGPSGCSYYNKETGINECTH